LSRRRFDSAEVDSELVTCLAISSCQPKWLKAITATYEQDTFTKDVMAKLMLDAEAVPGFSLLNGILRYKNKIWVASDAEMQKQLLEAYHSSAVWGTQECNSLIEELSNYLLGRD
jgi:hypothetical protein